jgi:hypothetical protein
MGFLLFPPGQNRRDEVSQWAGRNESVDVKRFSCIAPLIIYIPIVWKVVSD